jgi:membrane protein implicated in regulation of membrane protease activity
MLIIGFVLIAVAVAAATILIVQNAGQVRFHALGHAWTGGAYWLLVAGLIIFAVAVLGLLAVRRSGTRPLRRDRAMLAERNDELAERLGTAADDGTPTEPRAAPAADRAAASHSRGRILHRHGPAT